MRPNLGLSKQMTYLIVVFFLFGSRAISKSFAASFQRFRFRGVLACISLYGKNSKYIFCPAQFVNCRQIVQQLNSSALCPSPKTENSSSVVHFVQRRNGRFHVVVKQCTSAKFAKKRESLLTLFGNNSSARAELLLLSVVPKSLKHVQSCCFVYKTNVF